MDEHTIRELIGDVKAARLPRRRFIETMAGLGLTLPMAAQLLTTGKVHAQQGASPPPRRGAAVLDSLSPTVQSACNRPCSPQYRYVLRPPDVTADATSNFGTSTRPRPASNHDIRHEIWSDEKRPRALGAVRRPGTLEHASLGVPLRATSSSLVTHPPSPPRPSGTPTDFLLARALLGRSRLR